MSATQPQYPQHIKGLEYFSLTQSLKHFRQTVEKDSGTQVQTLEMNLALILSDLCRWVGLSDERRREVLGKGASVFVDSLESEPVKLSVKH